MIPCMSDLAINLSYLNSHCGASATEALKHHKRKKEKNKQHNLFSFPRK